MSSSLPTRRWVPVVIGVVVAVALCVLAGRWQLSRYEERVERNDAVARAAATAAVPVADLLDAGQPAPDGAEWRQVRAAGRYDADRQLVLRLRPLEGEAGSHVLTPLVTDDGAALLVDRGFVAQRGASGAVPEVPPPPGGEVEVVARVRLSETGRGLGGDPASGAVRFVDVTALGDALPYPVYGAWAELVDQDPAPEPPLQLLPPPAVEQGPNLSYALQWFLFAVVAVVGGVLLLRSEARGGRRPKPPARASARAGAAR